MEKEKILKWINLSHVYVVQKQNLKKKRREKGNMRQMGKLCKAVNKADKSRQGARGGMMMQRLSGANELIKMRKWYKKRNEWITLGKAESIEWGGTARHDFLIFRIIKKSNWRKIKKETERVRTRTAGSSRQSANKWRHRWASRRFSYRAAATATARVRRKQQNDDDDDVNRPTEGGLNTHETHRTPS